MVYEHRMFIFSDNRMLNQLVGYPYASTKEVVALFRHNPGLKKYKNEIEDFYKFGKAGYEIVSAFPVGSGMLFVFQRELVGDDHHTEI